LLASKFVTGLGIDSFWWGLLFSLILSFVTAFVNNELDKDKAF